MQNAECRMQNAECEMLGRRGIWKIKLYTILHL